jgi:hypothetical protein
MNKATEGPSARGKYYLLRAKARWGLKDPLTTYQDCHLAIRLDPHLREARELSERARKLMLSHPDDYPSPENWLP